MDSNRDKPMENLYYIPNHFRIQELVSRRVYERLKALGKLDSAWSLFDPRFLWTIDALRDAYAEKIIINDWDMGGHLQQCGFRGNDTDQGAEFSQHRYGRAGDLHFEKTTSDKVRSDCLKNPWEKHFQFITCVEMGVSWFHGDVRNWDKNKHGILMVRP
jgi:hypothetical protein